MRENRCVISLHWFRYCRTDATQVSVVMWWWIEWILNHFTLFRILFLLLIRIRMNDKMIKWIDLFLLCTAWNAICRNVNPMSLGHISKKEAKKCLPTKLYMYVYNFFLEFSALISMEFVPTICLLTYYGKKNFMRFFFL